MSKLRERLRARLGDVMSAPVLGGLVDATVDRPRLDRLYARLTKGRHPPLHQVPRSEIVGRLVGWALSDDAGLEALVHELDRAASAERALVASIPVAEIIAQVGRHQALGLPRQGGRLLWAVCRDERLADAALRAAIGTMVAEGQRLREQGAPRSETPSPSPTPEAPPGNAEHERQRAALLAELGRKEAELARERELRLTLAKQLTSSKAPAVAPPDSAAANANRRLDKRVAALTAQVGELSDEVARLRGVDEENARLVERLERLRERQAAERRAAAPTTAAPATGPATQPLVTPPPRPGGGAARVGVFVDVANLAGAARRLHDGALDYAGLLGRAVAGRKLVLARAYAIDKGDKGFAAFSQALRAAGFKVLGKRPREFADGSVKADWDVALTVDALTLAGGLDVVVLGSGDGDFVPLVRALKSRGVRVELVSFEARTAAELLEVVDAHAALDQSCLV